MSVQSRKGSVIIFKALFWRTRTGILVLCTGTEFTGGFIDPEELNQSCQRRNLGVSRAWVPKVFPSRMALF